MNHPRRTSTPCMILIAVFLAAGSRADDSPPACTSSVMANGESDVVRLKSGSVLVGRLKSAERGTMTFDIAGIGETAIRLDEVAQLDAPGGIFQVDVLGLRRAEGHLRPSATIGQVTLSKADTDESFSIPNIVRLARISDRLADRIEGYIGAGFSYSSGTDSRQLSLREGISHTTRSNKFFQFASLMMTEDEQGGFGVDRLEAGIGDFVAFSERWLGLQYFQYQEIPGVGVDSRVMSVTAAGKRLVHDPLMDLALLGGVAFQREKPIGASSRGMETEIPLLVDWEMGIPRYETKLSAVAIGYFGLSNPGRRRFDFRMNADHELFNDFKVGLHYLYNFDSEPLNVAGDKASSTVTFQVGYEF